MTNLRLKCQKGVSAAQNSETCTRLGAEALYENFWQASRPPTPSPGQPQNPQDPSRNLKLPAEDLAIIKDRVFGLDNFYVRLWQSCSSD